MKILLVLAAFLISIYSYSQKVVLVIIDGARYSETFGDESAQYIPYMKELSKKGSIISRFYNDSLTYTSAAIPAIWCGTWTDRIDTTYLGKDTQYAKQPTIFEYFRKQKDVSAENCVYSLKYVPSLWLPSFDSNYGPNYWPYTISKGSHDNDVLENTLLALEEYHPEFTVVYLAGVDHYGHSGVWNDYTEAIKNADKAVNDIWSTLQNDPFYKDNTVMIVTNDHGRHDDSNGGFKGHGCACNGCRQIMFLAVGPGIKENYVSTVSRRLPDVAVTAAAILGVNMEKATGNVVNEIFTTSTIQPTPLNLLWNINSTQILFTNPLEKNTQLWVYNCEGKHLYTIPIQHNSSATIWNRNLNNGLYILALEHDGDLYSKKILIK